MKKICFEEEAVFEVSVKYMPGIFETTWKIKDIPELISMKFKNELWENLRVDVGKIEWVNNEKER